MRIGIILFFASVTLSACELFPLERHREHEHRRDVGDLCHDQDDCERGLVCARADGGVDRDDDDDDGVCTAASAPTPAPAPGSCASIASVVPGGNNPCPPSGADGGARASDGGI